jgi:hypothetical protein
MLNFFNASWSALRAKAERVVPSRLTVLRGTMIERLKKGRNTDMDGNFAAVPGTLGLVFVQKGMCEKAIGAPVFAEAPPPWSSHEWDYVSESGRDMTSLARRCILARGIYSRTVRMPVAMSATAQTRSRLNHAFRRMPTPTFANTSHATAAVTMR